MPAEGWEPSAVRPYNLPAGWLCSHRYRSQLDGLQALCGSSFPSPASPSGRGRLFGPAEGNSNMTIGTVKFFNDSKGYGFIAPDGGGNDAFVHISAVENSGMHSLRENQRVSYDLQQDRRGKMAAVNLKPAEGLVEATAEPAAAANDAQAE